MSCRSWLCRSTPWQSVFVLSWHPLTVRTEGDGLALGDGDGAGDSATTSVTTGSGVALEHPASSTPSRASSPQLNRCRDLVIEAPSSLRAPFRRAPGDAIEPQASAERPGRDVHRTFSFAHAEGSLANR